jgi:Fanconi anemia group M protein
MLKREPLPKKKRIAKGVEERMVEGSTTLDEFSEEAVTILEGEGSIIEADQREMPSTVVEELMRSGFKVKPLPLGEGDYRISDRVVVERKTTQDLSDSLIDGRLFDQMTRLRETYERPMVVIEGDGLFNKRNIKKNAVYGALASITVDFNIPIMFTSSPGETAEFLMVLSKRESKEKRESRTQSHIKKGGLKDIQIRTLSALPGISTMLAERLISHFGTLEKVFTSTEEELREVEGIGKRKAKEIKAVLTGEIAKE